MPIPILHLMREEVHEHCTIGKLFLGGDWRWWTLEDTLREGQPKIPGQTCIPAGRYQVVITQSARFGRPLPLLLNVPGFTGIRIHPGNTDKDTAGCILVGGGKQGASIIHSRIAADAVMGYIAKALATIESVWIEIVDPPIAKAGQPGAPMVVLAPGDTGGES